MNRTTSAIVRALELAKVLDVEHTGPELHAAFRAVRHELETLRGIHCPQAATAPAPELKSASKGRGTRPGSQRHLIMGVLDAAPQADFQVANHLRMDVELVRKRRHELMAARWVAPVEGEDAPVAKVHNPTTRRECTAYQLTPAGVVALGKLRSGQVALFSDEELGNGSVTKPDNSGGCDVSPT
jgi:hypothetical protein